MTEEYMPKKEIELLHKGLETKIDNTAYIINAKVDSSMKELMNALNLIQKDSTETKAYVKQTNGKANNNQKNIEQLQEQVKFLYTEMSKYGQYLTGYKTDVEYKKDETIKEQAQMIKKLQEKDQKIKGKVIIGIIMAILAIASFIGLINADFVKALPL